MRIPLILALVCSSSAFAAVKKVEVYRVVGVEAASDSGWQGLRTVTGSVVFVRCETKQFDDAARDRVAGFESADECRSFVKNVARHASPSNPVEISIGKDLGLEMRISL